MKKIFSLVICLFSLSLLLGDSQELLNNYFQDQSYQNIEAILKEASDSTHTVSDNFNLLILHFNELSKALSTLEADSNNLQAAQRFQLANIYLEMGKYKQALVHYNYLNENFANWSCPWRHKGEAYYKLQDWENAKTAFLKAIETREEHYDAYLWLARVELKLGENKAALKTYEKAMSYKGKDIEDAEEEFSNQEESFLKLEILKANKMRKDVKKLENDLREKYPDNDYWEN